MRLDFGGDAHALARGIEKTYATDNLGACSLLAMFEEKNTRSNLLAQIDLQHAEGRIQLSIHSQGGGSSYQDLPSSGYALLREDLLLEYLDERIVAPAPPPALHTT